MSRLYCVKLITDHFDSIINKIDVYTETLLQTIDPNSLVDERMSEKLQPDKYTKLCGFDKYLSPGEAKFTPGVTRVVDYINSIRDEMIDRVQKSQQETLDFYYENRKEFEIDPRQMDAEQEVELKRRLFGKSFCFVLEIEAYNETDRCVYFENNEALFKLYLISFDHYLDPDAIDYIRCFFENCSKEFEVQRFGKLFTDRRIMVISLLVDYIRASFRYLRGERLIDVKLKHLLENKIITMRLNREISDLGDHFAIDLPPSSVYDFTNLDDLTIKPFQELSYQFELKSIGPFPNLTKLLLKQISIKDDTTFQNMTSLKHFTLGFACIKTFGWDIHQQMPNLEVLVIEGTVFMEKSKFIGCDKLDKLERLQIQNIFKCQDQDFKWLANSYLTHLKIDQYNDWKECPFPISIFPNLKHMEIIHRTGDEDNVELDLNFQCESKLETLILNSDWKSLCSNLAVHKNLKCVELSGFVIDMDDFKGLTQIEELFINRYYQERPREEFHPINRALIHLPNLKKLNLSDISLEKLGSDFFICNPQLTHLDLSNNYGLKLKKGDFQTLSNLKHLILRGNNMSELAEGVFLGLDKLEELDLEGNNDIGKMSLRQLDQLKSLRRVNF